MANTNNSVDLIYSEIKERLRDQMGSVTSLDTKAGVVIVLIGTFLGGLINSTWFLDLNILQLVLILGSLLASVVLALLCIKAGKYRKDPEPGPLIDGYIDKKEKETKKQLIRNFSESYNSNKSSIGRKVSLLNSSLVVLAVSILLLCIVILHNKNYSCIINFKYDTYSKGHYVKRFQKYR